MVENPDDVATAVHRYRQGGPGFSDLLILAAAERRGATPLYTFDHRLARRESVTLVGHNKGGVSS